MENKNIKLTLKDRVLILNSLLPEFDDKEGIKISIGIKNKLDLTQQEKEIVEIQSFENGQFQILFKEEGEDNKEKEYVLTEEELNYLKKNINALNDMKRFTMFSYETYLKILNFSI